MGGLTVGLAGLLAVSGFALGFGEATMEPLVAAALVPRSQSICVGDSNQDGLQDIRDIVLIQAHLLQSGGLSEHSPIFSARPDRTDHHHWSF